MNSQKCKSCGASITGRRADAIYCSQRCRATEEKRRMVEKKTGVVPKKRGPNTGRSKKPGYYKERREEYAAVKATERKKSPTGGYKGRYAPARVLGFRSMFEVKVAAALEEAGVPFSYETLKLHYNLKPKTYTPDMVLENGIVIEAKGFFPGEDRQKMVAVKTCNPDADIRFVFQKADRKISKAAGASSYGRWAEKNGFPWAEGTIPVEWFNEKAK